MHVQVNSKSADIPKHLINPHKINDYFTSTFQNNDLECSNSIFFYRTNKFQENCSFSLTTADQRTVLNVINNIKSNAGGVDGVTLQMLKLCFPVIGSGKSQAGSVEFSVQSLKVSLMGMDTRTSGTP
nr:unnamed protein product [Callosobruchus analis]